MGLLIDTSVLVAVERGEAGLERGLAVDEPVGVSVITLAEYWKGVERAATPERRAARIAFIQSFRERVGAEAAEVDEEVALGIARLWAKLEATGTVIPAFDLIIAATAIARDWRLATRDAKDFGRVPGLELVVLD